MSSPPPRQSRAAPLFQWAERRLRSVRAGGWVSAVFGALLLVWLVIYFAMPPANQGAKLGSYSKILARGDGHYMYLNTVSMALDGDLDLQDEFRDFGDPFKLGASRTATGRHWIYPIGTSLLQVPFFLLAHGTATVANALGADIAPHGYTLWHQRVTFLGALLAGFFALVLGYRLARRYVSRTSALYGVVIVGLGSGLVFYAAYRGSYAHAWSAFAVALFLEYWDRTRGRHDVRRYAIMGAYVGLVALVRMQDVVVALIPVVGATVELVRRARARDGAAVLRLVGCGVVATGCALLVAAPQLASVKLFYGSFFAVPQGEQFMRWDAPFLWEVLFSSRNGLFVWTPLLYIATLGLFAARAEARVTAAALALAFFAQLWVNGSTWSWWGDASFGARRMLGLSIVWIAGAAFAVERLRQLHARFPRLAPHAAILVALSPFVVMNLELSDAVSTWKQRTGQVVESSKLYARSWERTLRSVTSGVGNPASWPHNLLWAIWHDAPIERYDLVVGGERLFVSHKEYGVDGVRVRDELKISKGSLARYALGAWGAAEKDGARTFAWARDGARLLLPLFVDDHVVVVVHVKPADGVDAATLEVNGAYRESFALRAGYQPLVVAPPAGVLRTGTNELRVRCAAPGDEAACAGIERVELKYEADAR